MFSVPKKVACGALVAACAKASAWEAALGCLQRMQEAQITPGAVEVGTVAAALGQARGREQAWQLMRSMAELWRTHGEAPPVNLEGILKQGKGILVANKPEGISTERFAARLSARLGHRPLSLISRLDFPTSGVLPLALGAEASFGARWFQAQLAARLVAKEYLCLCEGLPMGCVGTRGRVSAPLRTLLLDSHSSRSEVSPEGREACTEYEVLRRYSAPGCKASEEERELMLVAAQPITGRTHQIRVHFAFLGRPLVGDLTYSRQWSVQCPRLFLHCRRFSCQDLSFAPFVAECPLPAELQTLLDRLDSVEASSASQAQNGLAAQGELTSSGPGEPLEGYGPLDGPS
ncbi:unnamed protein product [Effrenium voratum]|nr:unnamed protein product [Effrenium voratum]